MTIWSCRRDPCASDTTESSPQLVAKMPTPITQQIESRVQSFVTEITTLVRTAAIDSVGAALGASSTPAKRGPGRPKGYSPKAAKAKAASAPASAKIPARPTRGGRRLRRSSEDVEAISAKFLAFVKGNDGKRLEEISKGLGINTADLKLPAQKLLAAKSVKTSGQKRGTKYHVAGGGTAKVAKAAAPKKAAKQAKKA